MTEAMQVIEKDTQTGKRRAGRVCFDAHVASVYNVDTFNGEFHMKTKAQKWGNSLAVRVPKHVVQETGIGPNDDLEVEVVRGKIVLTPVRETVLEYRLSDLLKKVTKKNIHRETDWGKPRGKEVW